MAMGSRETTAWPMAIRRPISLYFGFCRAPLLSMASLLYGRLRLLLTRETIYGARTVLGDCCSTRTENREAVTTKKRPGQRKPGTVLFPKNLVDNWLDSHL